MQNLLCDVDRELDNSQMNAPYNYSIATNVLSVGNIAFEAIFYYYIIDNHYKYIRNTKIWIKNER